MTVENILNILPIDSNVYMTGLNHFESFLMNVLEIPEIFHNKECIRIEYDKDWDAYKLDLNCDFTYLLIWKEHEKLCCEKFKSDFDSISAMNYYSVNSELYIGAYGLFDRVLIYDEKTGKIEKKYDKKILGKEFLDFMK